MAENGLTGEMFLSVKSDIRAAGAQEVDERDLDLIWVKEEKVWKISTVKPIETVKRPETY